MSLDLVYNNFVFHLESTDLDDPPPPYFEFVKK